MYPAKLSLKADIHFWDDVRTGYAILFNYIINHIFSERKYPIGLFTTTSQYAVFNIAHDIQYALLLTVKWLWADLFHALSIPRRAPSENPVGSVKLVPLTVTETAISLSVRGNVLPARGGAVIALAVMKHRSVNKRCE